MDEMKSMLVKLCDDVKRLNEGQDELVETVKRLDKGQDEIRQEMKQGLTEVREEIQEEMAERLSKLRQDILDEVIPEIRAVNERLAACQLVNGKKVDVLFDADETRRQLLEIHDEEIPEIKSTLFNYDIRIKNLESKVIGA